MHNFIPEDLVSGMNQMDFDSTVDGFLSSVSELKSNVI